MYEYRSHGIQGQISHLSDGTDQERREKGGIEGYSIGQWWIARLRELNDEELWKVRWWSWLCALREPQRLCHFLVLFWDS